jgi:antitoxin component of RelBE/YafQ-DinJ toxin-antitoxin module
MILPIYIDKELKEEFKKYAEEKKVSMSEIIRWLIALELDKNKVG